MLKVKNGSELAVVTERERERERERDDKYGRNGSKKWRQRKSERIFIT
jgi:hypothetical protein